MYFQQTKPLTRKEVIIENIKALALAAAIGVGMAILLVAQLSK